MSRKLTIYVKETHQICQENPSDMSRKPIIYISNTPISISRTTIKYIQDTHPIPPGHLSSITRTPIKYHQHTHQISPGHHQISPGNPSNFSRTPIKNLQTHIKYFKHRSNISKTHIKYLQHTYQISSKVISNISNKAMKYLN